MSLCDSCFDPGRCCKRLKFYNGAEATFWTDTPIDDQLRAAFHEDDKDRPQPFHEDDKDRPQPFRVASIDARYTGEDGREYAHMTFTCSALLPDGRCGNYENRPWLCRVFEPGQDVLCVHWRGAEGGTLPIDGPAIPVMD